MTSAAYRATATEAEIQQQIVEGLRWLQIIVLVTSRQRKRCRQCGQVPSGGDGVTRGLPDLFVRKTTWPPGCWLGIEVKGPKTRLSKEQAVFMNEGAYAVCRDFLEALGVVRTADRLFVGAGLSVDPRATVCHSGEVP